MIPLGINEENGDISKLEYKKALYFHKDRSIYSTHCYDYEGTVYRLPRVPDSTFISVNGRVSVHGNPGSWLSKGRASLSAGYVSSSLICMLFSIALSERIESSCQRC